MNQLKNSFHRPQSVPFSLTFHDLGTTLLNPQKMTPHEQGFFCPITKHCSNTAQAMSRVFEAKNETLLKHCSRDEQHTKQTLLIAHLYIYSEHEQGFGLQPF
jgi:hypothetical protein